jgi:hypothetical protein
VGVGAMRSVVGGGCEGGSAYIHGHACRGIHCLKALERDSSVMVYGGVECIQEAVERL